MYFYYQIYYILSYKWIEGTKLCEKWDIEAMNRLNNKWIYECM